MTGRGTWAIPAVVAVMCLGGAPTAPAQAQGATPLERYLEALAERRLLAAETGSVERLRDQVRRAEELHFDERYDEATLLLYEVVESPRFADFDALEEYRSAELTLATALARMGALRTAQGYLLRVLAHGADGNNYFGPAFRRYVDVALEGGDLERALERLEALDLGALPEDALNERRYLQGRARYDAGDADAAEEHLASITRKSRFYANAQYLRGVIHAARGQLDQAEERFCAIATTADTDRYTFYVDERYFAVKDLAWLALGRVAHEGGRGDDAFYYYFQVPQDSDRVAEALFESAYAMYEADDHDTAVDLLDQLEAHFPKSPFVDEATLLRGYVHLARCEFDEADALFQRFQSRFGPLAAEIDRVLGSQARQARFYETLLADQGRAGAGTSESRAGGHRQRQLLMALLRVDPTFHGLHARLRTLDAESARAGRLEQEVRALASRLRGDERPRAAAEPDGARPEADDVRRGIEGARAVLARMTEQLDLMRRGGATGSQLEPLEQGLQAAGQRLAELERRLHRELASVGGGHGGGDRPGTPDVEALLQRDLHRAQRFPARVAAVRADLVRAANVAALRSLRDLRDRLAASLRRARIGRIDAVMGSKRRIELQIESLAAGRFPAELMDPLRVQGLLRDDEEYWPFEGEYWADEFDETVPFPGDRRGSR
jgi:tetratricopeptide (TPR) repeat protein